MIASLIQRICKRFRKKMGKPSRKPRGKSVRNGNSPSPYTKYHKSPYQYSHYWDSSKQRFVKRGSGESHRVDDRRAA